MTAFFPHHVPGQAMLLIMTTTAVTTITALSMSAISTNGVIKGGKASIEKVHPVLNARRMNHINRYSIDY